MSAITVSADGNYIFLALENASGQPVIARCAHADLSAWTAAYNPAAGTAANVAQVPGNADLMLFYGNFGSGVQVILHTVSSGANTNISPTGLTTKVVNGLAVNPSNADEIIITINTDQDLLRTIDAGANWVSLNAALGFNATALAVVWQAEIEKHRVYAAGQVTGAANLLYSPNSGTYFSNITGANLVAATNVAGLEVGYVA
jgi:hypothetical protein